MDALQTAFGLVFQPYVLMVIALSALYGLFVGAIPGLTATMATALLVPVGDAPALAQQAIRLLEDPGLARQLREQGLAWVRRFTWPQVHAQWRQAYLNEAARVMGIRQVLAEIGQLEIHTDVLDEEEIKMLGQVVEASIRAHEEFWAPLVPLRPFNQQIQVYAWARQADHDRLHRDRARDAGSCRPDRLRGQVSRGALRRHEPAGGDCAGVGARSRHSTDGRTIRRAG